MNYDKIVQIKTNEVLEESEEVRKHRLGKIQQMRAEFLAKKQLREEEIEFNKEQEKEKNENS